MIKKLMHSLTFALTCWTTSAVIAEETIVAPPSSVAIKQASDYSMSHNGQTFIVMFDGEFVAEEYVGGGGFISSRDWATFGEFIRLQGKLSEKQIVAAEHLAECFKGTKANPAYGLTWWLKQRVSPELVRQNTVLRSEWADVANSDALPADLVAACGAGKQRLYIIPSRKLVVVRQGGFAARGFSDVIFLQHLLKIVQSDK